MIIEMVKENSFMQTEIYMKVNAKMILEMVMENTFMQVGKFIKVNG
jgi:hypothetical protein